MQFLNIHELTQENRIKIKQIAEELFGSKYRFITNDQGRSYRIVKKSTDKEDIFNIRHDLNWIELCIKIIAPALGIKYLTIPTFDENFNLGEYIINLYEELKEIPKEDIIIIK